MSDIVHTVRTSIAQIVSFMTFLHLYDSGMIAVSSRFVRYIYNVILV